MMLDVGTIVALLGLSTIIMSGVLGLGLRTGRGAGFGTWNLALGLITLGWILLAMRTLLPPVLTHALGDSLLFAGLCLQACALLELDGRRAPGWLCFAPGPLLFLLSWPLLKDYAAFTLLVSGAIAAALALAAWFSLRIRGGPARVVLGAMAVAAALMLLLRAMHIALDPASHPGAAFTNDWVDVAAFGTFFATTLTSSFCFLILQRERAEAEMRHLAMFDGLTDLLNRRAFMELAERELARARRAHAPVSALMLDLDHFKQVNDRHGHAVGDHVLQDFAAVVRRCVRREDLAGRYGGEEFCVLLPGQGAGEAAAVAERIRSAVEQNPLGGLPAPVTVSIGVAIDGVHALDALIARADGALYLAKAGGRNRVRVFDAEASNSERRAA